MRDSAPLLDAYVQNTVKGSWRPTSTSDHRTWPTMAGFHPSFTIAPSFFFSIHLKESFCLCAQSHVQHKGENGTQTWNIIKSNKWRKHTDKIPRYEIAPFNILLSTCCISSKAAQRLFGQINIAILLCMEVVCSSQSLVKSNFILNTP